MSTSTSEFLLVSQVSKTVKSGDETIVILRDINLQIKRGESIAIIGTSGTGKTTLLTLLAGLDLPTTGEIEFLQQRLSQLNEDQRALIRLNHLGFIFQSFELLDTLTALENVMLPLEIRYFPRKKAKALASEWLQRVGLMHRLHHFANQLSGGEQQRVAIARAFVNQPDIIFADEMTGNLDDKTSAQITDLLFSVNKQFQTTLVLVTHDKKLSKRCDHQYLLDNGNLTRC